jgi:P27 family predicted phage terminase small subunit
LDKTAKAEWRRLVGELHSRGLVDGLNRDSLALYCTTLSRFRKALAEIGAHGEILTTQDGKQYRSPWLLTAEESQRQLTKLANELGLSPAARDRLGARDPAATEPDSKSRFFRVTG